MHLRSEAGDVTTAVGVVKERARGIAIGQLSQPQVQPSIQDGGRKLDRDKTCTCIQYTCVYTVLLSLIGHDFATPPRL